MIRLHNMILSVSLFLASPVFAADHWSRINDALFMVLVDSSDGGVEDTTMSSRLGHLWDTLAASGKVASDVVSLRVGPEGAGKNREFDTHSLTINGTDFTVLSGGIDGLPAGLFLRLGPNGHEIPGLRGSLSDCSEANETNCDRIDFSRSDSLTLGLASCLCEGQARDLGKGMLGLDCYFGRGGTYMNYTIGYGPMAADTVTLFVDYPELATRQKICLGTPLAHRFPQLLVREGDKKSGVAFDDVETAMRPSLIAAQVDEDYAHGLASATILRQLTGLND